MQPTLEDRKDTYWPQMRIFTQNDSYFPPSKSTGSQNNTAKILPGLNPNLLKQVESLPLRATQPGEDCTISYPFSRNAGLCTRYVRPSWKEIAYYIHVQR